MKGAYQLKVRDEAIALRFRSAHANPRNRIHGHADKQLTHWELNEIRELSREMERDNPIVSAAFDRIGDLVVGDGFNLQISHKRQSWADQVEQLWADWWGEEADHTRKFVGSDLDKIILRSILRDGDIFIHKRQSDGEILLIEGDRVRSFSNGIKDEWRDGVKVTKSGRPVSYRVVNDDDQTEVFVSANEMLHIANRERLSQTRGLPILASCATTFDDIDSFVEACIVGARTSVAHAIAITKPADPEGSTTASTTSRAIEAGGIIELEPGEEIKNVGSTLQMQEFGAFVTKMMRIAGLKLGLSLEVLSMDFSQTNFSSARASIQLVRRAMNGHHNKMLNYVFKPLLKWKVEEWIAKGMLTAPRVPWSVTALPPKEIQVDPLKEANANIVLANSFSTYRDVALGYGRDFDELLIQRNAEIRKAEEIAKKLRDELGIKDLGWRDILGGDMTKDENFFKYINGEEDGPQPTDQT